MSAVGSAVARPTGSTVRPPDAAEPPSAAGPAAGGDLVAGARAMAGMVVGFLPFGLLVGAAVASSAHPLVAWLSTWTIYGGAAHLAVLQVLAGGSGWAAAAAVGLLINMRMTAYAAAMAPTWRSEPVRRRVVAALVLTDATWALGRNHAGPPEAQRRFYLGASLVLLVAWPVMVTTGLVVGPWLEAVPGTALLPVLTLGGLVVPQLRDRPGLAAGVTAAATAVATAPLGSGAALGLCGLGAAIAGTLTAVITRSRP